MKRLILLGLPGAGKGTQAKILATSLQIPHISVGDILREECRKKTLLGSKVQPYMSKGELIPDELILNLIRHLLNPDNSSWGCILDGFPRKLTQAFFLDNSLKTINQTYDLAIYLDVPDSVVIPRIRERALRESRLDGTNETVIQKRLEEYHRQTAPVIELYSQRNQLVRVNGSLPIEEVTATLRRILQLSESESTTYN